MGKEDIVLVMDGSGSVGSCQFNYGRDALAASIKSCKEKELKCGPNCRIAAVTFASNAYVNFNFLASNQAINQVKLISYPIVARQTRKRDWHKRKNYSVQVQVKYLLQTLLIISDIHHHFQPYYLYNYNLS